MEFFSDEPVQKRYSLLEEPEIGESWPEGFDAITILQKESRFFKAKEARRNINRFFEPEHERLVSHLYGVLWHRMHEQNQSVVMVDTNNSYMRAKFITATILGTPRYGYRVNGTIEVLQHDMYYPVSEGELLTYFKAPIDFAPTDGEILGMMIAELRDELSLGQSVIQKSPCSA